MFPIKLLKLLAEVNIEEENRAMSNNEENQSDNEQLCSLNKFSILNDELELIHKQ